MNRSHFLFAILVSVTIVHAAFAETNPAEESPSDAQQIYTNKPFHGLATIHSVTDKEISGNTVAPYVSTMAKDPFGENPKRFLGEIDVNVPAANKNQTTP